MIEIGKKYTKPEMTAILGTRSKQGIDRKLERYEITFAVSGRGEGAVYEIQKVANPFKVFAITELGIDAGTDFHKLRNFYYYFFNDEEFMAMPDEVKETRLRLEDKDISRQTIALYTQKLERLGMIDRNGKEYIYYFAYKGQQRIVERPEYSCAWKEYWALRGAGVDSFSAIYKMIAEYGGVARKQVIPEINGIFNEKIDFMLSLIQQSIENDVAEKIKSGY